jgi:hypothetical protein
MRINIYNEKPMKVFLYTQLRKIVEVE